MCGYHNKRSFITLQTSYQSNTGAQPRVRIQCGIKHQNLDITILETSPLMIPCENAFTTWVHGRISIHTDCNNHPSRRVHGVINVGN